VPIAFEPGTRTTHEVSADVHLRPSATLYRGKTVMLIDERAQSQSEHTALLFRAVHGTVLIGSPTAGANGTGSNFSVPGGLLVGLTGDGVSNPDGSQLQRVGLRPDVPAQPTIAGIRAGRDEVLDAAVEYVQREYLAPRR